MHSKNKNKSNNIPPKRAGNVKYQPPNLKKHPISAPQPKKALHNVYQNIIPEPVAAAKKDETLDNILNG